MCQVFKYHQWGLLIILQKIVLSQLFYPTFNWNHTQPNYSVNLSRSTNMSSDSSRRIQVPEELKEVLLQFSISFLVEQPPDVIDYAVEYFTKLQAERPSVSHTDPSTDDQLSVNSQDADGKWSFMLFQLLLKSTGMRSCFPVLPKIFDCVSCQLFLGLNCLKSVSLLHFLLLPPACWKILAWDIGTFFTYFF